MKRSLKHKKKMRSTQNGHKGRKLTLKPEQKKSVFESSLNPEDQRVLKIITTSLTTLKPISCHVEDISCWYFQRKLLGSQRFWFHSIKYEKSLKKWQVLLYEAPWRKSVVEQALASDVHTTLRRLDKSVNVTPTIVGVYDSEERAEREYFQALRRRNRHHPLVAHAHAEMDLQTQHRLGYRSTFHLVIISKSFHRKTNPERLEMIYECLLNGFELNYDKRASFQTDIERHYRKPSRYLDQRFIIQAKTPGQWKQQDAAFEMTHTERFGKSHLTSKVLSAEAAATTSASSLMRLIERGQHDDHTQGSVFSHFYYSSSDQIKKDLGEEALAREMHTTSATGASSNTAKTTTTFTNTLMQNMESAMPTKLHKYARKDLFAALMLQRLFRGRMQSKVLRRLRRKHTSAMIIQTRYRGYRSRVFSLLYAQVMRFASVQIQSVFRSHRSREQTKLYKAQVIQASTRIQSAVRGYLARSFVCWYRKNTANGLNIQRVFRGYLGRKIVRYMRQAQYKRNVLIPAAISIQCFIRCAKARRGRIKLVKHAYHQHVVIPAAVTIQCGYRSYSARCRFAYLVHQKTAVMKLQKCWSLYLRVRWSKLAQDARFKDTMATAIQALARGYIARQILKRRKKKWRFHHVVIPSVIQIQRTYRGYRGRILAFDHAFESEAARMIQGIWRKYRHKRHKYERWLALVEATKFETASRIQRFFRQYASRKKLLTLRLVHKGRQLSAVRCIQDNWRRYCLYRKTKDFQQMLQVERCARKFRGCVEDQEMIQFDQVDAADDLKATRKSMHRIEKAVKKLKKDRIMWERRIPEVDEELAKLDAEDEEQGWTEALETEKVMLIRTLELSQEELVSQKLRLRDYEALKEQLELELEDLETDADEILMLEIGHLEEMHRMEIRRAIDMADAGHAEAVRKQMWKWKIPIRKKYIQKHDRREDVQALVRHVDRACQGLHLGSVSFAKNQHRANVVNETVKARLQHDQATSVVGHREMMMMHQQTFDSIVQTTKDLVGELTHNIRDPPSDIREDSGRYCQSCGQVYCSCDRRKGKTKMTGRRPKASRKNALRNHEHDRTIRDEYV